MSGATAYERRQAVGVSCVYCETLPGYPCTSWRSQKATRTHMLRVYAWRREVTERSDLAAGDTGQHDEPVHEPGCECLEYGCRQRRRSHGCYCKPQQPAAAGRDTAGGDQ